MTWLSRVMTHNDSLVMTCCIRFVLETLAIPWDSSLEGHGSSAEQRLSALGTAALLLLVSESAC